MVMKDILASLLMGVGGASGEFGQGLQQRQKTKDEYMNDLQKMYMAQMMEQNSPLYQAQVGNLKSMSAARGRAAAQEQKLKDFIRSSGERELAKTDEAKSRFGGARELSQERLDKILARKEDAGLGGMLAKKYLPQDTGDVLSGMATLPLKMVTTPYGIAKDVGKRALDTGFFTQDTPLYSKGGQFGREGTFEEPQDVRTAREGLDRLKLTEDVQTASPIRQQLEGMGTSEDPASLDDWTQLQYYKLTNQAGGAENIMTNPQTAMKMGILNSTVLDLSQKQLITEVLDGTKTAEEVIMMNPEMEQIFQALYSMLEE